MGDRRIGPGDILARKYRVDRVLGSGNMGIVVAATHIDLGQLVAVKHMLPGKDESPEIRERFLREARAAVRLKSQHVARVLDVGADEQEAPYIVMEYLEGQDLGVLLKEQGPMAFGQAVEYVLQACEGIGEAHAAGIVHRDLKPANLFLTKDVTGAPCVKVVDFGVSKLSTDMTLTQEGQALGSPLFMSPESMYGAKNVDNRSDIYSLGVLLYQLVAGHKRAPFQAETVPELCRRVLFEQPTPLAEYRPDAPQGFESVILKCIAREKDQRFQNVAQVAAALLPFAPARARVYPERIARVVGVDLPVTDGSTPSLADLHGTIPIAQSDAGPRSALPSVPPLVHQVSQVSTLTGAGSTPSLAISGTQSTATTTQVSATEKPRRTGMFVALGVVAVAVPALILGFRATGNSTATPGLSPETNATTALPAPSTNAPVITVAPTKSVPEPVVAPAASSATAPVAVPSNAPVKPLSTTKKPSTISYDER